jgi:hypothetical protein
MTFRERLSSNVGSYLSQKTNSKVRECAQYPRSCIKFMSACQQQTCGMLNVIVKINKPWKHKY